MPQPQKRSVLFITDTRSAFDAQTERFNDLFEQVDVAQSNPEAMKFVYGTAYDVVIGDLTASLETLALLKQIKDMKKEALIFALVAPKDADKLYGIADLGIHAFELLPEQFEAALEAIADFNG
jgi:DNA-binding NtrC family response regulator